MKAKGVPSELARALKNREERLHNMPGEGIGKRVIIKRVKNVTRYERTVEWHGHRGGAGA
jgi:hypothetical protein